MFDRVSILVTGNLWIGAEGARPIGTSLHEMIVGAKSEITIVAYRLTVSMRDFIDEIEQALARGCVVRIVLDGENSGHESEQQVLSRLIQAYSSQLQIFDFISNRASVTPVALHAKAIVCDRKKAIIGSANFSKNGLEANHEMAVYLSGKPVRQVSKAIDKLINDGRKAGTLVPRS